MSYRQTGYPIATVKLSQELSDAGWKPAAIRRILEREGHPVPTRTTIYEWINPDYRDRQRDLERQRRAEKSAQTARFRLHSDSAAYREAFMRRLRAEGLSCAAIAKVHGVVFGQRISDVKVWRMLREEAA